MARLFYHVMQDNAGNLLFDVSGTMRIAGSGTLATIYGDEALTVILPNPMTNHPSFGSFKCFLGVGDYDFYMARSGYTFETLTGVQGSGTMADQNANAVAITGGTIGGLATLAVNTPTVTAPASFQVAGSAIVAGNLGVNTTNVTAYQLHVNGTGHVSGNLSAGVLAVNASIDAFYRAVVAWDKTATRGLLLKPTGSDTGFEAIFFMNVAGGTAGSITTTATATAYNTSSDVRLKHAIAALTGALGVVRALRPVAFRWNADDSEAHGFLAHELQVTIPDAVTGLPDAVNDDGSVRPQQVDHSKLVPWLTAALKDALEAIDGLTARVASLETQLGV